MVIALPQINYKELDALLTFLYTGEVCGKEEDINGIIHVAKLLRIVGFSTETNHVVSASDLLEDDSMDIHESKDLSPKVLMNYDWSI
jgi:hypothetical protein